MISKWCLPALLICLSITVACDTRGLSYGDPNSIIVVMAPERWEEVAEDVYTSLETRIVTVRDEKMFTVTYQEPYDEFWPNLRRFQQMLVAGPPDAPWIQEAFDRVGEEMPQPGIHELTDVWSRGQNVTVVLLSDGGGADELKSHLPAIHDMLDGQYRGYARNRMYMSGVDSALADTLYAQAGFSMMLPEVYRWRATDSTYMFRNDNPDPSELIREVSVTWLSPAVTSLNTDEVLALRAQLVTDHYLEPQDVVLDGMNAENTEHEGHEALEIQAQWRNPPDRGWPAGGPIIARAITCESQDRTYLVDSWLYAPGREKYEYMIQLETILDSFRCS